MSIKTPFQIEIPKRGRHCALGQEELASGMEILSALKDGVDGIYERRDFCLSCWETLSAQNANKEFSTVWRSKIPSKRDVSDLPKQRDARAMVLLKSALQADEQLYREEAFVLSLYLARKRLIFFRQAMTLDDGQKANLYECAESEEMLCIRQIALSKLEVDRIQQELAAKFKM